MPDAASRGKWLVLDELDRARADKALGGAVDELRRLIRDHLVSEVHVFNARYHDAPPPQTPLIEKITLEPRRAHEQQSTH